MNPVIAHLRKHRTRYFRELTEYLAFPSVSAQPKHKPDLEACAEWIVRQCRSIGMDATVERTKGNPVVLARTPQHGQGSKPRFLVYGHYDVQPPEPFELWNSPPFKATVKGDSLFARGSTDNKGQNFAHLKVVEAYLATGTELRCDLTFLIEGEEEVGSPSLPAFLKKRRKDLACEVVVISDNVMPDLKHPALTYALRGIAALEIKIHGPSRDLHSGLYGGSLLNPATALCQVLAQCHDSKGRVNVPGLYDDVAALSPFERRQMARLPHNDPAFRRFLGVPALNGEKGFTSLERRTARPTFEINGLTSGYQGVGSKTIVPSWASAKITLRLVPNQDPAKVIAQVRRRLLELCPPGVRMEIESGHGAEPYWVSPEGTFAKASLRALKTAFGREPVIMREGGSIPIVTEFKKHLGVDSLLLGMGLPDDNAHSPNEKMSLTCLAKGMEMGAHLWPELTAAAMA